MDQDEGGFVEWFADHGILYAGLAVLVGVCWGFVAAVNALVN